jgi:hypothetical protein
MVRTKYRTGFQANLNATISTAGNYQSIFGGETPDGGGRVGVQVFTQQLVTAHRDRWAIT